MTAGSTFRFSLIIALPIVASAGCVGADEPESEQTEVLVNALTANQLAGKILFEQETFGGNGRTCETCHSGSDKTIDPDEVEARFQADPNDPLFADIDSDDGTGSSFNMLREHSVVRVNMSLPANIRLADDPSATSVELWRGVPTANNIVGVEGPLALSGIDPIYQYDGRAGASAEDQAIGAVFAHFEPTVTPTAAQLGQIKDYQSTLFDRQILDDWANDFQNPEPQLPTPDNSQVSEKRGKSAFMASCKVCHGFKFLNVGVSFGNFTAVSGGLPGGGAGDRFENATEYLNPTNPVREYIVTLEDGTEQSVVSPDPGRALITGEINDFNRFKIPTLWGIPDTAPYFSDGHSKTLLDVVQHYQDVFELWGNPNFQLSDQNVVDIAAYLELL